MRPRSCRSWDSAVNFKINRYQPQRTSLSTQPIRSQTKKGPAAARPMAASRWNLGKRLTSRVVSQPAWQGKAVTTESSST